MSYIAESVIIAHYTLQTETYYKYINIMNASRIDLKVIEISKLRDKQTKHDFTLRIHIYFK